MDKKMYVGDILYDLLENSSPESRALIEEAITRDLPEALRREYEDVIAGTRLPALSSDIIAKKVFDPDEHPERLEYLLRKLAKDDSIEVSGSFSNEGFIKSEGSKKVVFDIPARLVDGRLSNTEIQVAEQSSIFKRGEIYSSEMLMIQYSVNPGEKKSSLNYENAAGVILVILMLHSADTFRKYDSIHYVHRFIEQRSDTGIAVKSMQKVIYVQLDKCLEQFLEGKDGEKDNELQLLLAAIADINNEAVNNAKDRLPMLKEICNEVAELSHTKEVQTMLLAEKYAQADLDAALAYKELEGEAKGEARGEARGGNKMLYQLVQNGDLTVAVAAKNMGVSEEEFKDKMALCGYKLPEN